MNINYKTRREALKILGIHYHTLYKLAKNNEIEAIKIGERQLYNIDKYLKEKQIEKNEKRRICYCRVSSQKQKENLKRQITYMENKYPTYEIISDIGSGINYKKKGLKELLKLITQNKVDKVVVLYEDRLLRFGYELVEYLASLYNCEIEIIDNTEKSEQQELVEDLVQIITVFSCKLQGKRANKAKKLIRELINGESEVNQNDKRNKSNVST